MFIVLSLLSQNGGGYVAVGPGIDLRHSSSGSRLYQCGRTSGERPGPSGHRCGACGRRRSGLKPRQAMGGARVDARVPLIAGDIAAVVEEKAGLAMLPRDLPRIGRARIRRRAPKHERGTDSGTDAFHGDTPPSTALRVRGCVMAPCPTTIPSIPMPAYTRSRAVGRPPWALWLAIAANPTGTWRARPRARLPRALKTGRKL
jgi:hypothetical protein